MESALLEFCRKLPKIELHAHLNGSLSEETLRRLGVQEDLLKGYKVISITENLDEKLNECFKLFQVAHSATTNPTTVFRATKHVIEEFHKDNVIYLELRTTPRKERNITKKEYIEAVIGAIQPSQNVIKVKLILAIDRSHDLEVSQEALDLILEMHEKYPDIIKGVDLCGNPNEGAFYEELFVRARKHGLKVTLHCGEVKNVEEVSRMLEFKPERIGHATCLHPEYEGTSEIWKLYQSLSIPVECCLTSNVMCGTSKSYREHHVQEWIKNALPFCLNTDDKGVFNTSLSKEYFHAANDLKLSKNALFDCALSAVKYSFGSDEEKEQLQLFMLNWKKENVELFDENKD